LTPNNPSEGAIRRTRRLNGCHLEKAITKLHSGHDSGREIRKRVPPGDNGSAAISAMHADPVSFAKRSVKAPALVAKLAAALLQSVAKDYSSVVDAKRAIKKLLE
jgi:hypothetical protein